MLRSATILILFFALGGTSQLAADWRKEVLLVSRMGDDCVAKPLGSDAVRLRDRDPQVVIEGAMKAARTTVVLGGEYIVSDRVDVPRAGVTLIIDRGAVLKLNGKTKHTTIGFKARNPDYWQMLPMIYNTHDDVRVFLFGEIVKWRRTSEDRGKQTLPIMFDGRNTKGDCGLRGGSLVAMGRATESFFLIDSSEVSVPIAALNTTPLATLVLEGCEDCSLGLITSIAKEPGGKTHETIDLNSRCLDITIERLVGERSFEIIDCNESHVIVEEAVSVGTAEKLFGRGPVSGPRFTDRHSFGSRSLAVKKTTVLNEAVSTRLIHEIPKFPAAFPRFTLKTTVEVTLKDGRKTLFAKSLEVDLR